MLLPCIIGLDEGVVPPTIAYGVIQWPFSSDSNFVFR